MLTDVEMAMFALLFGHAALALVWLAMNWAPWINHQPARRRRYIMWTTHHGQLVQIPDGYEINPKATDWHQFLRACWEFHGTGRGEPDGGRREAAE